ncbi:Hypothetical predicted protein [Marmota monax]|uniref:Uncharacterized protein n=1 Tax=Marmota monax TaxID=9995 RepID=A0A5E4D997_MARMO|nr:Hypothetical predicted protein [Marmota monax]
MTHRVPSVVLQDAGLLEVSTCLGDHSSQGLQVPLGSRGVSLSGRGWTPGPRHGEPSPSPTQWDSSWSLLFTLYLLRGPTQDHACAHGLLQRAHPSRLREPSALSRVRFPQHLQKETGNAPP